MPDLFGRLEAPARRTGRTKSFYARETILEHLEDLEDLEDPYLAEKALVDVLVAELGHRRETYR